MASGFPNTGGAQAAAAALKEAAHPPDADALTAHSDQGQHPNIDASIAAHAVGIGAAHARLDRHRTELGDHQLEDAIARINWRCVECGSELITAVPDQSEYIPDVSHWVDPGW